MANMTYNDLLDQIKEMTDEQRNMDVTVFVTGVAEYYPLVSDFPLVFADPEVNDTLDPNHPYLVI